MKRNPLMLLAVLLVLLIPITVFAQSIEHIEIPFGTIPDINGEISPGEWDFSFDLAGAPLRVYALHSGEQAYLAFETMTPADSWESFFVKDNGDGTFYSTGDTMILCSNNGCNSCAYTARYDFSCDEDDLPSAAKGGVVEFQAPLEAVVGSVTFGLILDGS